MLKTTVGFEWAGCEIEFHSLRLRCTGQHGQYWGAAIVASLHSCYSQLGWTLTKSAFFVRVQAQVPVNNSLGATMGDLPPEEKERDENEKRFDGEDGEGGEGDKEEVEVERSASGGNNEEGEEGEDSEKEVVEVRPSAKALGKAKSGPSDKVAADESSKPFPGGPINRSY
ncbi:hypothetical protein Scep_005502 [Stephania cephalantha]|uniref:Uncharacterized protein n=1 Tax=Stephania cephalantha TaxID=152367 RepID=A0AAP0KVV5_9MAGN